MTTSFADMTTSDNQVSAIVSAYKIDNPDFTIDSNFVAVLQTICDSQSHNVDGDSVIEALEDLESNSADDFTLDFDGNEYRIISEDAIWDIYVEEIKQIVEECYDLKLDNIPDFVAWSIDWEQTAKNAYADGYGHTFSGYDGSEEEAAGYYIFRTN